MIFKRRSLHLKMTISILHPKEIEDAQYEQRKTLCKYRCNIISIVCIRNIVGQNGTILSKIRKSSLFTVEKLTL